MDFHSPVPFDQVQIVIVPGAGSDFLADNFATTALPNSIPEPASLSILGMLVLATAASLRKHA
jgi:hypothetical protein